MPSTVGIPAGCGNTIGGDGDITAGDGNATCGDGDTRAGCTVVVGRASNGASGGDGIGYASGGGIGNRDADCDGAESDDDEAVGDGAGGVCDNHVDESGALIAIFMLRETRMTPVVATLGNAGVPSCIGGCCDDALAFARLSNA